MESLKGYRTIIFGVLIAGLGTLTAASFIPWVGEMWGGVAFAVVGVVILALRTITDTPVGEDR